MNSDVTATTQLNNYVTAKQLAQALGLSKSGLYSLCKRGKIPAGVKIGHSRRWSVSDIQIWLKDQRGVTA